MPIVLGQGRPFFDGIADAVELEGPEVIEGTGVTHLRYVVKRGGDGDAGAEAREKVREVAQAGRTA